MKNQHRTRLFNELLSAGLCPGAEQISYTAKLSSNGRSVALILTKSIKKTKLFSVSPSPSKKTYELEYKKASATYLFVFCQFVVTLTV